MDDINMERSGSQITESGKLVNDGIELQVKAQMNSKMVRVVGSQTSVLYPFQLEFVSDQGNY